MNEAELPEPKFEFSELFTISFKRTKVGENIQLTDNQKIIVELIRMDKSISSTRISEMIGISLRNTKENLSKLKEKNVIEQTVATI